MRQTSLAAIAAPTTSQLPSPRTVATPAAAVGAMPVAEETDGYGDGSVAGMTHVSPAQALPPVAGSAATVPAGRITPPVAGKPSIYLQVGAFSDAANAQRVADQLNRAGLGPVSVVETQVGGRSMRRVRVGPLSDVDTADRLTNQIAGMGLPRPQVAVD
ncbi:SPOR domain-containing protein [Luteibacter yeojuensis]|uniref:SPOR domain-containing protein n=2 Tax=Luteibacter yeojuensis TaxID=345309 RepID=A0A7X5TRZ5_9GAMM|nr:SPOR domain-containing protein [Luteibacter yeojuensis]